MGFEDLAKRMGAREVGDGARTIDPDQLIAEAARADRRWSRVGDLVLGPLLAVAGMAFVAVVVIAIRGREFRLGFGYSWPAAVLLVLGLMRTFRGVTGVGRSSATGDDDPAGLLLQRNELTQKVLGRAVKLIAPPEAELLLPEPHGTRSGGARVKSKHVAILTNERNCPDRAKRMTFSARPLATAACDLLIASWSRVDHGLAHRPANMPYGRCG